MSADREPLPLPAADQWERDALRAKIGEAAWAEVAPLLARLDWQIFGTLAWDNSVALPAMQEAQERLGEPEIDRSSNPWRFIRWPGAQTKTTQEERDELRNEARAVSRKAQVVSIPIHGLLCLLDDADLAGGTK